VSDATRAPLESVLDRPDSAADGATVCVLLHGRGSHRKDLQALRPSLPDDWVLVTPEAPFPAAPWGYGPGSAWYRYVAEDVVVEETLEESLSKLDDFLGALPGMLGFEPGASILGGFSQGGTTSLVYALTRPGSVSAVLNFSGFLVGSATLDESGVAPPSTPIFWGHGSHDPAIPISLAEKGRARLRRAGAKLVTGDYPIGHWIAAEEIQEAVAFAEMQVAGG
jgi:phospholipase/carboxylesterase